MATGGVPAAARAVARVEVGMVDHAADYVGHAFLLVFTLALILTALFLFPLAA